MTGEEWAGIVADDESLGDPFTPELTYWTGAEWRLYGKTAFRHRRALIALVEEMRRTAEIVCLCGDVFTTTETMAEHLWMAHGHEVPPKP